jgi:hypothetical protein
MKQVRDGLFGNFIPLDRAVAAIGARLTLTTDEIDGYRSLNCSKADDDVGTLSERAAIGHMLRRARAAGQLLQVLNRVAEDRPKWYDSSQGIALLDDGVSREGTAFLVQWMKHAIPPVPRPFGKWSSNEPQATPRIDSPFSVAVPRSAQVGFNIDELIRALDAARVPHGLGESIVVGEGGRVESGEPANTDSSSPNGAQVAGGEPLLEAQAAPVHEAAASSVDAIRPPPKLKFRGALEEVMNLALASARDAWDPATVFEALMEIARAKRAADPKSWIWVEEPLVMYKGTTRTLKCSKRHVADRYRQLSRKAE